MDQMKAAFDHIRAEEALKARTLAHIEKHRQRPRQTWRFAAAAACCLVLLLTGAWLYFTPTARISIDMDAPITLEINRFDRVISASSSGSQQIPPELELTHLTYSDAMEQILSSSSVSAMLDEGEIMAVSVIAPEAEQSDRLMTETFARTGNRENAKCGAADPKTAKEADRMGLSCAKYEALKELQALDPTITADDIRHMSMSRIHEWIKELCSSESEPSKDDVPGDESPSGPPKPDQEGHGNGPGGNPGGKPGKDPDDKPGHGKGSGNGNRKGKKKP